MRGYHSVPTGRAVAFAVAIANVTGPRLYRPAVSERACQPGAVRQMAHGKRHARRGRVATKRCHPFRSGVIGAGNALALEPALLRRRRLLHDTVTASVRHHLDRETGENRSHDPALRHRKKRTPYQKYRDRPR